MRCIACDVVLNDTELTKKGPNGEFLDLCGVCYEVYREAVRELEDMASGIVYADKD